MTTIRRLTLLSVVVIVTACRSEPEIVACSDVGWIPIIPEIRDQSGAPAAIGATVQITRSDGYTSSTVGYRDSLHIFVGESVTGIFSVVVTKPYHLSDSASNVVVHGKPPCNVPSEPARPKLRVVVQPNAPLVRQIIVPPHHFRFGDGNISETLVANVVAAAGYPTGVVWVSRDTTVARITPDGRLTSVCRTSAGSTFVIASAQADPSIRDSVAIQVSAAPVPSVRCP